LDGGRISFGESKLIPCRRGLRPTLAVRKDGTVVVAVEDKLTFTLRCYVGKINDSVSEVTWKESPDTIPNSTTPSVAINDKNNIILFYKKRVTNSLKYPHVALECTQLSAYLMTTGWLKSTKGTWELNCRLLKVYSVYTIFCLV
jgi:hypothetical protein